MYKKYIQITLNTNPKNSQPCYQLDNICTYVTFKDSQKKSCKMTVRGGDFCRLPTFK